MRDTQGALFYYHPRGIATLDFTADLSANRIAAMSAVPVRRRAPGSLAVAGSAESDSPGLHFPFIARFWTITF